MKAAWFVMAALLALALQSAVATHRHISAEAVRASHYSEARMDRGLEIHPSAPCCNTATAPHKRGVTTGRSCRGSVQNRAERGPEDLRVGR